ncbi:hypothetical protein AMTRI_Chr13g91270 [Amborella trichopoda]
MALTKMDLEGKKFGRGPRELTGAVDLLNHYKLWAHHDFFCKRSLPLSISDTHYLHNVVGDTEIRKGEGMELDQLFHTTSTLRNLDSRIRPFDLDTLRQAFQLRETEPIELPAVEKGTLTFSAKAKVESTDKDRKHKKHKDKDKDKEHKKHKRRHKDRSKDKDREKKKKDKGGSNGDGDENQKKHQDMKRKHDDHDEYGDIHRHKKKKHKNAKVDDVGLTKD